MSHSDHQDDDRLNQLSRDGWRLPAQETEQRIADVVAVMVSDRGDIARAVTNADLDMTALTAVFGIVKTAKRADNLQWVERIDLDSDRIKVAIRIPGQASIRLERTVPMIIKRRGIERRLVIGPDVERSDPPDPQILRAIGLGLRFWEQLNSEQPVTAVQFADQEKVDNRFVGRALPLAFLAPDVVEHFIDGRQAPDWTSDRLIRWEDLPLSWDEQRRVVGLA